MGGQLGGRWICSTTPRLCPIDSIVRIGVGRDAADSSFLTYAGQLGSRPGRVWVEPLGGQHENADWTTGAVSLAKV